MTQPDEDGASGLVLDITRLRDDVTVEMADDLRARIASHPAKDLSARWANFNRTLGAHAVNGNTLEAFLQREEAKVSWEVSDDFMWHMLAYLTNFVSSAKMVVEHSRNLVRHYEGTDFALEYERRKNILSERTDVKLVVALRDYILHARNPRISLYTVEDSFGSRSAVLLPTDALLADWTTCPGPIKAYLRSKDAIRILEEVISYREAIKTFYGGWMLPQFELLHGEQIANFNSLVIELRGYSEVVVTTRLGADDGPTSMKWHREI